MWSRGTVQNAYIHVKGPIAASYNYCNDSGFNPIVKNCTIYHDLKRVTGNYSGYAIFDSTVTNVNQAGSYQTNLVLNDFGGDITATKDIDDIVNAEAGVYYGDYAWE